MYARRFRRRRRGSVVGSPGRKRPTDCRRRRRGGITFRAAARRSLGRRRAPGDASPGRPGAAGDLDPGHCSRGKKRVRRADGRPDADVRRKQSGKMNRSQSAHPTPPDRTQYIYLYANIIICIYILRRIPSLSADRSYGKGQKKKCI